MGGTSQRWDEVAHGEWPAGPLAVHDARRLPDGATLDYDVCIVGTGAAGTTAALALAGRGLRIAVLEGGGTAPDAVSTAFTEIESSRRHVDQASRERWLGGTTNAWTGGKTTLDAIDLAVRPWVPGSGWPIDPAHLRRCYERAADLLDRPPPALYDAPPPVATGASAGDGDGVRFDGGDLRTLVFHEDAAPLRFGTLLLDRLRPGDGVDVITLANVTEVLLDEPGTRVAGVEVATVNGRRLTVRAPLVVLGCGAIENARLLLASRSRRPAGLGNGRDQVGRWFQDHPKGFTAVLAVDPTAPRLPAAGYWPARQTAHGRTRWGIGLTEEAQRRDSVLNSYVRLEPTVLSEVPEAIAVLKRVARGRVRGLDPTALGGLVDDAPDLARLARFRLRNEGPIDLVQVRSFLEQEPRAENRVRLSDRRDPLGRPLAAVDWELSELDRRSVRVLHEALAGSLRRHGLGDLAFDLDDDSPTWETLDDASHHAGTTRMGTDPRASVTDPDGRVHDVDGLYLAGPSLFPTSGYANPVFTIAAMSLHVADAVAAAAGVGAGPATVGATAPARDRAARPARTVAGTAEAKRWISARRRARHPRPAASTAAAVVWTRPGRAALLPVEVPAPGVGQVSVLTEVSAVSLGTERARWLGLPGAAVGLPHQPGYSLAGTIHAVGPGVYDLEAGTPVAVWGAPHQSLVTVAREQVHTLADGLRFDAAALVTLGAIAELGVARAGDAGGRSLAVVGAGAIGLLAQRIAAADGAKPCTVIAASSAKDRIVAGDPAAAVAEPADVDGLGADIVIEATGAAAGLDLALRAAAPGGTVVVLGTTRAEQVLVPLDLVAGRALRVVGAHAGLLDAPGGTSGLDRRSAAQRFLDRVASGAVRVDDLVTFHADPASAADLLDRVGPDRSQVVPVIDWWRLAPGVRARPGGLGLPNPFRQGLSVPLGPAERPAAPPTPPADHPAAPERHRAGDPVVRGPSADAPSVARAALAAAGGGPVRVQGTGPLADAVAALLPAPDDAVGAADDAGGDARVVVDVDPTGASLASALAGLGPDGVVVVAGRVGRVDLDVQTELHRRGAAITGVGEA